MKKIFAPLLPIVMSVILFSCDRYAPKSIFIPAAADLAIYFDYTALRTKGNGELLSKEWFPLDSSSSLTDSIWIRMMSDKVPTGIDLQKGLYLFRDHPGPAQYVVLQGMLKDTGQFNRFNRSLQTEEHITYEKGIRIFPVNNYTVVVWNAYRFLCIADAPYVSAETKAGENTMSYVPPYSLSTDSLISVARTLFRSSPRHSLLKDQRFKDMLQAKADLHLWLNTEEPDGEAKGKLMTLLRVLPMVWQKGNPTAMDIRFEKGGVRCSTTQYLQEKWTTLLEQAPPPLLSADMLNRIPPDHHTVLIGVSLPPEMLPHLTQLHQLTAFPEGTSPGQLSLADVLSEASKGTYLIAMGNPVPAAGASAADAAAPTPLLFATTVKQEEKLRQYFNTEANSNTPSAFTRRLTAYGREGTWFAAASREETVQAFLRQPANVNEYAKKMAGHSFSLHVNLSALRRPPPGAPGPSASNAGSWAALEVTGDLGPTGQLKSQTTLTLADPEGNSLGAWTR